METFSEEFTNKKRAYFIKLGQEQKQAFNLHKTVGLWDVKEGKKEFGNVSEHCLVEIARVSILGELLSLSDEIKSDLKTAAALHDFYKKGEIQNLGSGGLTFESFEKTAVEAEKIMRTAGFSNKVIEIASSIGHGHPGSIVAVEQLLQQPLTENSLARLIMHYVDSYTMGSDWANSAERVEGREINDIDRRYLGLEKNPRLNELNEAGREYFQGETLLYSQRRVAHLVEAKLAELISQKLNKSIPSLELPNFIDAELQSRIANS